MKIAPSEPTLTMNFQSGEISIYMIMCEFMNIKLYYLRDAT